MTYIRMTVTIFPYLILKKPTEAVTLISLKYARVLVLLMVVIYMILFCWYFLLLSLCSPIPQGLEFKVGFCVLSFIFVAESFTHSIMFSHFKLEKLH